MDVFQNVDENILQMQIKPEPSAIVEDGIWNCAEGGQPSSLKSEVKEEDDKEEELKPLARVFLNPAKRSSVVVRQEHEDPLAVSSEDLRVKSEFAADGEYNPGGVLINSKTRLGNAVQHFDGICNEENDRTTIKAEVKAKNGATPNKNSAENSSHSLKSNVTRHPKEHSVSLKSMPGSESEVQIKQTERSCHLGTQIRIHSKEHPYQCSVCEKRFTQKSNLVIHIRTHSGERPYECSVCHKGFSYKDVLVKHMRSHSGERPYECSICPKSFSRQNSLVQHMRSHSGERPHECSVCEKRFTQRSNLLTHIRTHSGERPYECSVCEKKFSLKCNLVTHIRTHGGERPYECSVCHKSFSVRAVLDRHMRTHSGEPSYECSVCEKRFTPRGSLARHKRKQR